MDQPAFFARSSTPTSRSTDGLTLECGVTLPGSTVAYRTYGTLNAARSNAVLVCHALTGDQYVAEPHPITGKPGWWERVVGPGRPVDTDRFFVICANVLGGCMGCTGPRSPRERRAGEPWGTDFPPVTIRDMVRAQKRLIDHLGIARLFAVIGGSMGGMQVLEWAALLSRCGVRRRAGGHARPITRRRTSPSTRSGGRRSSPIRTGRAAATGRPARMPARGLAVARMCAHITYLSEQALTRKFGRRLQNAPKDAGEAIDLFGDMFEVESYLRHQGSTFVHRFDANSLSDDHPRDGLFRPRGRPRRRSGRRLPRHAGRGSCWCRSRPTGCSRPPRAARSRAR